MSLSNQDIQAQLQRLQEMPALDLEQSANPPQKPLVLRHGCEWTPFLLLNFKLFVRNEILPPLPRKPRRATSSK